MNTREGFARKSFLLVLPFLMVLLMACQMSGVSFGGRYLDGSGEKVSEDRPVSNVERVSLHATGNLIIIQGNEEHLTVEADDNIMPRIRTEMHGRELVLDIEPGYSIHPKTPITYTLKVKDLSKVSVSGSGNVTADELKVKDFSASIAGSGNMSFGNLDANDVEMSISGSGKMKTDALTADSLDAKISGSGDYDVAGKVTKQSVTITGAGNFFGDNLESDEATVRIGGSGDVKLWTTSTLDATITGSGKISYYGKPDVSQTITGGGSVKSLGEHN